MIDLDAIRGSGLKFAVDPLGGAGVHYWPRIAERFGLPLEVLSTVVDPTFRFMRPTGTARSAWTAARRTPWPG